MQLDVITDQGASPTAPIDGEVWTRLERALATAYPPSALVAPMITPGTMDARWFAARGVPTYRFVPFVLDATERGRMTRACRSSGSPAASSELARRTLRASPAPRAARFHS